MNGNGKIAHLSPAILEQLCRRMEQCESGKALVQWLNELPEVRAMLTARFGGRPINEVNLSKWKAHGHRDWLARRDAMADARRVSEEAAESSPMSRQPLSDDLAKVLAAHYAGAILDWNGESSAEFRRKIRDLRALCRDINSLRRGDHRAARIELTYRRMAINPNSQGINPN